MPIAGERSQFAVQYELDEDSGGPWMFGRFCYWCGGLQVGDFELGTSLRDVLFQLERIASEAGKRENPRFLTMPAELLFHTLDRALFGGAASPAESRLANDEQWARHIIVPAVDVFDAWKGFLVESADLGRLVTAHLPTGQVRELCLKPGTLDQSLNAVVRDLRAVHAREAGRAGGSTS